MVNRITWSTTQRRRLKELGAGRRELDVEFQGAAQRDAEFQALSGALTQRERQRLSDFGRLGSRPRVCRLESLLAEKLVSQGFSQVTTPILMSRSHLAKMFLTADHPLMSQVFWIDRNRCLRPMHAPHLYCLLRNLLRIWEKPVRIFEIGPCFRRESGGAQHASEFTMLNLVEAGLPIESRAERLEVLAMEIADLAGVKGARLQCTQSEVYGETIDVVCGPDHLEIGSAAMGPHPLDRGWRITDAWMGIGFGLERLIMAAEGSDSIGRWGRSTSYLDGIRLNI
jgi:phenylalanyl-tRNA synthetase alpha chain